MRCTLLNSLERHLAPLRHVLTSLTEPAEQIIDLIKALTNDTSEEVGREDKEVKRTVTVCMSFSSILFSFFPPSTRHGVSIRRRGCALTSATLTHVHTLYSLPPPLLSFYLWTECTWIMVKMKRKV